MQRAISTDPAPASARPHGPVRRLRYPRRCALRPWRRLCRALPTALFLVSCGADAHLPELFGRQYVLAPRAAAPTAQQPAELAGSALDARKLNDALRALERQSGPYGAGLSDPLTQLAAVQMRTGNTVDALRSYERALHVLRINNGLLHPAQVPLLRALTDVYAAIEDRRSAQAARRYILRVHGMASEPLHDEALEDALAYFQAARDTFIDPMWAEDRGLYMQAFKDNEQLFKTQLEDHAQDYPALVAVGLSQLRNLYIVLGTDVTSGQLGATDVESDLILRLQALALGKGMDILDELLARLPETSESRRAELLLARANWQQWNGRWHGARRDYAATDAALGDSAADRALRRRLSVPAELPEDPVLWRSLQLDGVPRRAMVRASFRVSTRGEASRVKAVVVEESGHPALAGQLRRMLVDSHFRPAIIAGEPQIAEVDDRLYILLD